MHELNSDEGQGNAIRKPWHAPRLSVVAIPVDTRGWVNNAPADDTTTASGHS